jgi:hypothetical protein
MLQTIDTLNPNKKQQNLKPQNLFPNKKNSKT